MRNSSEDENRATLVGVGNPIRRDDGVGPTVVARMASAGLPPGVGVVEAGTARIDLLHVFAESAGVVLVDAMVRGQAPGTITRCSPEDLLSAPGGFPSLHHAGLSDILEMARVAGGRPEVILIEVEPGDTGWGEGFSDAVEGAINAVIAIARDEIGRFLLRPGRIVAAQRF